MAQKFTLLITASPQDSQSHLTAIKFARELIKQQIEISAVFFYQDAVFVANRYTLPPSDEPQLSDIWCNIASTNNFELQTCVAASLRRGIIDQQESIDNDLGGENLNSGFKLTGLGQLAAAMNDKQTKLVHFK